MADKIAVPAGENPREEAAQKIKKKHGKCCTCCIVMVCIFVVILGAGFGVGWYFGDKFSKEYLNMPLGDTLGVVSDLYWTNDKDVVTRRFSKKDLNGFYTEIKRNVFLKDSAEVDFDSALTEAVNKFLKPDEESERLNAPADEDGEEGDGSSITDILVDMIAGVLDRDHIDLERLNAYDHTKPETDEYIFNLADKQLAAFLNTVLKVALKNASSMDSLSSVTDMVNISKVLSLKQVVFKGKKQADPETGEKKVVAATADITVWIGLQDGAGQALSHLLKDAGMGWLSGIAGFTADVLLPENLYITLGIPLYGDAPATVNINKMNKKERARAYKLVNGILKMTGSDSTLDGLIDEYVGLVKPYLESLSKSMNFDNVDRGTISMDLLQTVTEMASEGLEGQPLTKADFIYVLQAVLSDPAAQLSSIEPYMYDGYYDVDGTDKFIKGGSSEYTKVDYEQRFVNELKSKYALKIDDGEKLTDVLKLFGVSLDGEDSDSDDTMSIKDKIDGEGFNALLNRNINDIKLVVTDRMLGASLGGQMKSLIGSTEGLGDIDLNLLALTFIAKENKPDKKYALLTVEVGLNDLLSEMGDGLVSKIASGLMPDSLLLTVTVDITEGNPDLRDAPEVILNSCANTDRALAALEKLVPSLDISSVTAEVESMLNDMLDEMRGKLVGLELRVADWEYADNTGWIGENGAMLLPDIFTVVTDLVLKDGDTRVVEPDKLKAVLASLNNKNNDGVSHVADDYSGFISRVVDKYYLAPGPGDKMDDLDDLTAFMTAFDTTKFRVQGNDSGVKYLAHDTRAVRLKTPEQVDKDTDITAIQDLVPRMSASELGALLNSKMQSEEGEEGGDISNYTLIDIATTAEQTLSVTLAIRIGTLLPDDVGFLIAADYVYVTANVDMNDVEEYEPGKKRYAVSIEVNDMKPGAADGKYEALLAIVNHFDDGNSFDIESQVSSFGEILYEQLGSINESLASSGSSGQANTQEPLFRLTGNGLELLDFYSFLCIKMDVEGEDPQTVKEAVQGMYPRSSNTGLYNEFNYDEDDIIYNRGIAATWNNPVAILGNKKIFTDREFNGYLKSVVENMAADENSIKVLQTVALAKNDTSQKAVNARAFINGNFESSEVAVTGDYIALTFWLTLDESQNTQNSNATGFYPNKIYATVVYSFDGSQFAWDGTTFINNMDSEHYEILEKIMSLNSASQEAATAGDTVNITTVSERGMEMLNLACENNDIFLYSHQTVTKMRDPADPLYLSGAQVLGEEGIGYVRFINHLLS